MSCQVCRASHSQPGEQAGHVAATSGYLQAMLEDSSHRQAKIEHTTTVTS